MKHPVYLYILFCRVQVLSRLVITHFGFALKFSNLPTTPVSNIYNNISYGEITGSHLTFNRYFNDPDITSIARLILSFY